MTPLVIDLPWPDRRLSPNSRGDRRGLTATRRAAVNAGYLLALKASREARWTAEGIEAASVEFTFYPPDKRARDLDNLLSSMKAASDGVAQALRLDDAKWREITLRIGSPSKDPKVTMKIGAIEDADVQETRELCGSVPDAEGGGGAERRVGILP